MVEQMVDPWPAHSNNNNLAFNGERMQRAVECYRKDKVTQPADLDPSTALGSPPPVTGDAGGSRSSAGSAPPASGATRAGALAH